MLTCMRVLFANNHVLAHGESDFFSARGEGLEVPGQCARLPEALSTLGTFIGTLICGMESALGKEGRPGGRAAPHTELTHLCAAGGAG